MEALWATILFSGFALEVIIRHLRKKGKKPRNPLSFAQLGQGAIEYGAAFAKSSGL